MSPMVFSEIQSSDDFAVLQQVQLHAHERSLQLLQQDQGRCRRQMAEHDDQNPDDFLGLRCFATTDSFGDALTGSHVPLKDRPQHLRLAH